MCHVVLRSFFVLETNFTSIFRSHGCSMNLEEMFISKLRIVVLETNFNGFNDTISGWKICCSRIKGFCDCIDSQIIVDVGKQQFEKAKSIPRENLLVPSTKQFKKVFPLVLDFNPSLPSIGKILFSHRHFIDNSPSLSKIFPKGSIIPSFRRTKNIKEILARPHRTNFDHTERQGCFKCKGKCDFCKNFLVESDNFSSARTGKSYPIRQQLHCKSKYVIYLITCNKCNVQYIGSTTNEFKVRFRNHESAMSTKKNTCEAAIHFNKRTSCSI